MTAYAGPVCVLMLCYEYPPLGGGTAAACSYLLAELALTDEVEVDLVTSGTQPQVERVDIAPHVRIHRLPVSKTDARFWRARELADMALAGAALRWRIGSPAALRHRALLGWLAVRHDRLVAARAAAIHRLPARL